MAAIGRRPALFTVGSGVPTETAAKGTLYSDTATGDLYMNVDGGTTWLIISGSRELVLGSSALGATLNNWAPAGYAGENFISVGTTTGGGTTITGLDLGVWQVPGFVVTLVNTGALGITLANENAGSTATNRFTTVGNASVAQGAVMLRYGASSSRWQAISRWSTAS